MTQRQMDSIGWRQHKQLKKNTMLGKQELFRIVGINGTNWFDPTNHGIEPNIDLQWRGYHCTYDLLEDTLVLTDLLVESTKPTPLFDIEPIANYHTMNYRNVHHHFAFTGEIAISPQLIFFHLPEPSSCTHLMAFNNGQLTDIVDFTLQNEATIQRRDQTQWDDFDLATRYGYPK